MAHFHSALAKLRCSADALLNKQYWAPDDPQKHPYDDTGWSFPALFNVHATRVTDTSILKAPVSSVPNLAIMVAKLDGAGDVFIIPNTGQSSLLALVYKLGTRHVSIAEKPFDAGGQHLAAGSLILHDVPEATLTPALKTVSLNALRVAVAPSAASHPVNPPRIAFNAHLDLHADRGLVALCLRPGRRALRLPEHANSGQRRRPAQQV